jgi:hypothetical protein
MEVWSGELKFFSFFGWFFKFLWLLVGEVLCSGLKFLQPFAAVFFFN